MAAPLLALAGTPAPVLVVEVDVEFPPDAVEAGEVLVVVPVPPLIPGPDEVIKVVPVDDAVVVGDGLPEDADADEIDSVLKGR